MIGWGGDLRMCRPALLSVCGRAETRDPAIFYAINLIVHLV